MGISTVASYRGAQLFEIIGLGEEVVDLCLPGTVSRISGAGFADLEADQKSFGQVGLQPDEAHLARAACSNSSTAANTTPTTRMW